ncbi:MAG TPA: hypothetical protein VKZ65_14400 [Glycomyces sp.]|nr:hypothetical protein [Glycomyces sp.]
MTTVSRRTSSDSAARRWTANRRATSAAPTMPARIWTPPKSAVLHGSGPIRESSSVPAAPPEIQASAARSAAATIAARTAAVVTRGRRRSGER